MREALARVVARLATHAGDPLRDGEHLVERRLPRGVRMVALGPDASSSWVLTLRKRRRVEGSLEELARAGSLSRPIAAFLDACLAARANVLVVGAGPGAAAAMLAALAHAIPAGERVAVLHDGEDLIVAQAQVIGVCLADHAARGAQAVRIASRLGIDRLIVLSLSGAVAAAALDAIGEGAEGVLAGVSAPSLRHGVGRLAAQVALAHPGSSIEASREAGSGSFTTSPSEVARGADARLRVIRVVELSGGDGRGARRATSSCSAPTERVTEATPRPAPCPASPRTSPRGAYASTRASSSANSGTYRSICALSLRWKLGSLSLRSAFVSI